MKKYLLTLSLMLAGIFGAKAQWSVIGDFNNWNSETSRVMTKQEDGSWTITLTTLRGAFKFQKDHSWDVNLGADYQTLVYGNGLIPLKSNGASLIASPPMRKVTITLNPETQTVSFSGLPQNMDDVDPTKPYIINKGCFLIGDPAGEWRPDMGLEMNDDRPSKPNSIYSTTLFLKAGTKFRISSALVNVPQGDGMELEAWMKLREYEYIPATVTEEMKTSGVVKLTTGEAINLQTPNPYDLSWEVPEEGTYLISVDLDAKTLKVEQVETVLYVCGTVENPKTGVKNDFISPSAANREFYYNNFTLKKIADGIFQGEFIIFSKAEQPFTSVDYYPQLRFFSDLLGWIENTSLGSVKESFYCLPVELTEGYITLPIVEEGLGNWGFHAGEYWEDQLVTMTVNLNEMEVTFALADSTSVDEIPVCEADAVFYNLQGQRIASPSRGIYIRITTAGAEKVCL